MSEIIFNKKELNFIKDIHHFASCSKESGSECVKNLYYYFAPNKLEPSDYLRYFLSTGAAVVAFAAARAPFDLPHVKREQSDQLLKAENVVRIDSSLSPLNEGHNYLYIKSVTI